MRGDLQKLRVLAVDDNRTNLHILSVFLKRLGHEVVLAENGQEALDCFAERRPDLILLDIMMPGLNGFEVARRLKAQTTDTWVPIIFLSALNRDENLVEGLEAGGDDYMTKPINFVVLEAKMRSMQRSLSLQQRATESLKRLQAISDNVMEAIVTIDTRGRIVACNSASERLFGWLAAELIGQDVSMLVPEPHRSLHAQYVADYLHGGPAHIIGREREVEAQRRDGSRFFAELGVTEVHLDNSRLFIGVIRDVSERHRIERQLRDNAEQLQAYYDLTQTEQSLAMGLMQKQLHRSGLRDPALQYTVIPAEHFSGDVVAAARSPEGRLYAMLADATGHGLTAAISVLPILALFYRMTKYNRSVGEIVSELNHQLRESMPVGRFVALTLLCLDCKQCAGEIWVGGTPSVFLLDRAGNTVGTFASTQLPLGIVANDTLDCQSRSFAWQPGHQMLLFSDGFPECASPCGVALGETRILEAVAHVSPDQRFNALTGLLGCHLDGGQARDDVSIMLITCAEKMPRS